MNIKAVLFDLDGVLVNSREGNREEIYYIADYHGLDRPSVEEVDSVYNLTLVEGLMKLFDMTKEESEKLAEIRQKGFELSLAQMKIDSNLEPTLKGLGRKYDLGIVTGRGRSTWEVLRHFGMRNYFDVIVDRTQYQRTKPDSESLYLAMERLGVKPHETIYVGDGDVDVKAANAAGVMPIFMSDRENHPEARYNVRNIERLGYLLMNLV